MPAAINQQVTRQDAPGCVAPESLQQAQQELANLKSSLGATRSQLAALQAKARTYSDTDYLQYSSSFDDLLAEMQALADVVRQQQAPLVHRLQDAQEVAARRALFAPTSAAAAAAQAEAAAAVRAELARAGPTSRDAAVRLSSLRREMQQELSWRYPPREYVLWRFKGRPGASKPPLAMPGLKRAVPAVRQGVQQLPGVSSK
jgi:predicted  nucleic acid-binding Zn-ribbon protein